MGMFRKLIHELHRRSLWQVLVIYLGASWLVLQAVDTLAGALSLPEWAPPLALFLLIVGFPIVLATAFVQAGVGGRGTAAAGPAGKAAKAADEGAHPAAGVAGREAPSPGAALEAGSEAGGESAATGDATAPAALGTHHRIFTWRNALLGGGAALVLLGALTIGYMVTRTMGIGPAATLVARGVLEERAVLILAEFGSRTGDTLLARAATEAFRIDLSQSDAVRVAEQTFIAQALRRMERGQDVEIDYDLAREIAQREGIAAIVDGEINSAGGTFVLAARLSSADSGEELAAFRETAKDSSAIVPAIDKLSKRLRERIGDSYRSLRADEPLEQVTTANLEALRKYSQAVGAIESRTDMSRGIALLEEAIVLDPGFAMAHRKLGVELNNQGRSRDRAVEALRKAFEHRDRLTERERYLTMATYYSQVTGESDRATLAYQNLLDLDPDDTWALNNLALIYMADRDFERAQQLLERAMRADSASPLYHQNTIIALLGQGKFAEGDTLLAATRAHFPDSPTNYMFAAFLESARWDYAAAEAEVRAMLEEVRAVPIFANQARFGLAAVLTARGRLSEAETYLTEASLQAEELRIPGAALGGSLGKAFIDLTLRGDTTAAIARVDSALAARPLSELSALDRPYGQLAIFFALARDPSRARQLWQEYETEVDPGLRGDEAQIRHAAAGAIALAEGRSDVAVEEFRRSDVGDCVTCTLYPLARAYEAAGRPDSAISVYEQLIERPDPYRLFVDQGAGALTLERLGQLYYDRGEWEKSAEYYARFVQLWESADPELQPRVREAQARLDELFAARG